ncbi:hypothetical protein [Streptodolium elevatio]|uniref:Uncharacterized protein n=1 Tax=Streptodolium elevatio TaxID=3157996 RepID=A0ABV3DAP3_9ACTN
MRPRTAPDRPSGRRARTATPDAPQAPSQARSRALLPDTGDPDQPTDRSPVGLGEIAPWYAAGALFTALGLLAGRVDLLPALATGAGVLAAGAAAWLVIFRNS